MEACPNCGAAMQLDRSERFWICWQLDNHPPDANGNKLAWYVRRDGGDYQLQKHLEAETARG